jgi:hypothetical protein
MKLAAIGMVKDEVDVIGRTLAHLANQGVDVIYLLENASGDGTWEVVRDMRDEHVLLPCELDVMSDDEVGYWQSRKMTGLAEVATLGGADWIVPFDADELWTAPHGQTLKAALAGVTEDVVDFAVLDHRRTALDPGGHPFDSMGWRVPEALGLPKVAFRAHRHAVVHAGNHGVDRPGWHLANAGFAVHHYPYRSAAQFISKARNGAAAYAETDLPWSTGQHWREYGQALKEHGEAWAREWFQTHFFIDDPVAAGLVLDPQGVVS